MRLTFWNERKGHFDWHCENNEIADKLAAYEDTGYSPIEIKSLEGEWNAMRKVVDSYRKAEEQGLLVRLPCKVGGVVYYITGSGIYKAKVVTFRVNESDVRVYCERNFMGLIGFEGVYGKTVFLTREEAEAALKGGQDE